MNATKMNETLNSIFVRLDVNLQNLTSRAIAQIIVKILYAHNDGMSKNEIKDELAIINNQCHLNDTEIDDILSKLASTEINVRSGRYYLSQPKRKKIENAISKSIAIKQSIIKRFFSRLNTDEALIEDWLIDATIKFFESYSEEWISDLKALTNYVSTNGEGIMTLISNRTNANKNLDNDDKIILPKKFFDFICTPDAEVNEFLWEYGTSAFASKLIRTMHGVDELTIETFRNSHCVLDTNILMFIALESRYKDAFTAIEKVFNDLGVKVSILYITKQEYEFRVSSQKVTTLHNLEKLGYDITTLANDDFTILAKSLHCKTEEDFITFFDTTLKLPSYIHDTVKINLLDDDMALFDAINRAQADETLKSKLNEKFKAFAKHDKNQEALRHDIGLLEGVKFLRQNEDTKDEKFYILSEEISINQYSKDCGFKNGLPLSLRVDTLINLLAVNNGGDTFNTADYIPLFANIIRMGLVPAKDTFRQTELYKFYKMNSKIADLPQETTQYIVQEMHKKMLDGMKEDDLLRDLNDMITDGEIKAKQALEQTQDELYHTRKERDKEREQRKMTNYILRNEIKQRVTNDYDKETKRLKTRFYRDIPLCIIVILLLIAGASYFAGEVAFYITVIFSIIASVAATILCNIYVNIKYINNRIKNRGQEIDRRTNEELHRKINNEQV